jgi:chromate transporter
MVVAFVGFVGATVKEVFGADSILLAGFAGASVATFFTFLPSFLFITNPSIFLPLHSRTFKQLAK